MIHWLLHNGIGQNFTASVLIGVPSLVWARIKLWPRWREHERKVHELHKQINDLNLGRAEPHAQSRPISE